MSFPLPPTRSAFAGGRSAPPPAPRPPLLAEPAAVRGARLREAVRQARSVAGPDAALRILAVDPESRIPERPLALAPWDPGAGTPPPGAPGHRGRAAPARRSRATPGRGRRAARAAWP